MNDICLLCLEDKINDKFKYKCKFCNKNMYCEECINSIKMSNSIKKFLEKCPLCRKKNWNNNIILENSGLFEDENYNIIMPETIITININNINNNINSNNNINNNMNSNNNINNNMNSNNNRNENSNINNKLYKTIKNIITIIFVIILIFIVGIIFVNIFYTCELFCLLDKFLIFLAFLSGIIIVGFIYSILNCIKYNNNVLINL